MSATLPVSMRHTNLTWQEAALLAGEVEKPSWESLNMRVHEKVSFQDTIWGFDLAGGAYYGTPIRVTRVKVGSRADKACIRPGDQLLRINDIDTSTLTLQEAHDIIISSGIYLKLNVTAPEDEEESYFCYEDPINTERDGEIRRWPWVNTKTFLFRESNAFMVPSRYEERHRDKFPVLPILRFSSGFETQEGVGRNRKRQGKENVSPDECKVAKIEAQCKSTQDFESHNITSDVTPNKFQLEIIDEYNEDLLRQDEDKDDKREDTKISIDEADTDSNPESNKTEEEMLDEVLTKSNDMTENEENRIYSRLVSDNNIIKPTNIRSC